MPASTKIEYPANLETWVPLSLLLETSMDQNLSSINVFHSLLNALGRLADTLDTAQLRLKKKEKSNLCKTVVTTANGITQAFTAVAIKIKNSDPAAVIVLYTGPPPNIIMRWRNRIEEELENPIREFSGKRWWDFNLQEYEELLSKRLASIQADVDACLKAYEPRVSGIDIGGSMPINTSPPFQDDHQDSCNQIGRGETSHNQDPPQQVPSDLGPSLQKPAIQASASQLPASQTLSKKERSRACIMM